MPPNTTRCSYINNQQRISLFLCTLLLITTLMSACTGTKPTDSSLPAGDASAPTNTDNSNGGNGHPTGEAHVTAAGILSQFIKDKNLLD